MTLSTNGIFMLFDAFEIASCRCLVFLLGKEIELCWLSGIFYWRNFLFILIFSVSSQKIFWIPRSFLTTVSNTEAMYCALLLYIRDGSCQAHYLSWIHFSCMKASFLDMRHYSRKLLPKLLMFWSAIVCKLDSFLHRSNQICLEWWNSCLRLVKDIASGMAMTALFCRFRDIPDLGHLF